MYKLLIVDDEQGIRQGMANSIPWNSWGFEVVGQACNGIEAVEFIEKNKPHIVLSDIRMPKMDGVELMQYLNQNYPDIKIIILSGYNDFEYLNMSIKNSVTEYLLKPTDVDEFEILFRKMRDQLDEEQKKKKEYDKLLYSNAMNLVIKGYANDEDEALDFIPEKELDIIYNNCVVIIFYIDDTKQWDNKKLYTIKSQIANQCNENLDVENFKGKFFLDHDDRVVGILGLEENMELNKMVILKFVNQLQRSIQSEFSVSLSAGISNQCTDIRFIPQSYEQAHCCVHQRIFLGSHSVVFYSELQEEDFQYYSIYFNEDNILKAILSNQLKEIERELEGVFSAFRHKVVKEYNYIDRMCLEFLFNVSRWSLKFNIRLEKVMKENKKTYTDIYELRSLKEKKEFLYGILLALADRIEDYQVSSKKNNSLAYEIKEYVDNEYASNLISLDYIAEKVQKSAAYVSKVFKNEIGYNFKDYVTKKRLEKSKELLQDPKLKIYEIAEQTGYADVSNFIKVFKKGYGISPNEYRNMLRGK